MMSITSAPPDGEWIKIESDMTVPSDVKSFYEVDEYGERTGRVKTEYPAIAATARTPMVIIYDFEATKGKACDMAGWLERRPEESGELS